MKIGNINEILGNILITYGVIRIIILFIALINAIGIMLGNGINNTDMLENITDITSIVGGITIIGCLIMLIINKKKNTGVVKGYTISLIVSLIDMIFSTNVLMVMGIFISILICMEYIKAGDKIKKDNYNYFPKNQSSNRAEWFFADNPNNDNTNKEFEKLEKKRRKLKEEIEGWKNLLDTGEITKEMYDQATEELVKKLQNLCN